ncbi:hypothetical protein GH714_004686 [Hevea brasiliensis]|uniref:EF-hand domain-containing protein n=1 Tax=Hevea brasiliensis TaxID=3981 RepID=A0A6A6NC80_HEVBR|nr:hypothetical protein GH714_004686 [Hevea brasiliensis]
MTTTPTPNSIFEIEWKRDAIKKVIKQFDEDCDGKLISAELNRCLTSCSGIHIDDGEIKRFLPNEDDSKINISEILQDSDGDENNFFQELRDMEAISFKWMKAKEVHVVINMNHLNKTLPPITIQKTFQSYEIFSWVSRLLAWRQEVGGCEENHRSHRNRRCGDGVISDDGDDAITLSPPPMISAAYAYSWESLSFGRGRRDLALFSTPFGTLIRQPNVGLERPIPPRIARFFINGCSDNLSNLFGSLSLELDRVSQFREGPAIGRTVHRRRISLAVMWRRSIYGLYHSWTVDDATG